MFGRCAQGSSRRELFQQKATPLRAIEAFVARTNEHPKPFHWRKREVKGSQLRNTLVNLRN